MPSSNTDKIRARINVNSNLGGSVSENGNDASAKIDIDSRLSGAVSNPRGGDNQTHAKTVIIGKDQIPDSIFDLTDVRPDPVTHGDGSMIIYDNNTEAFVSTQIIANPNTKIICGKY